MLPFGNQLGNADSLLFSDAVACIVGSRAGLSLARSTVIPAADPAFESAHNRHNPKPDVVVAVVRGVPVAIRRTVRC